MGTGADQRIGIHPYRSLRHGVNESAKDENINGGSSIRKVSDNSWLKFGGLKVEFQPPSLKKYLGPDLKRLAEPLKLSSTF
jgi:hypothetical protein